VYGVCCGVCMCVRCVHVCVCVVVFAVVWFMYGWEPFLLILSDLLAQLLNCLQEESK